MGQPSQKGQDNLVRVIVIDDNPEIHNDFKQILQHSPSSSHLDGLEDFLFDGDNAHRDQFASELNYELSFATQGQEGVQMVKDAILQKKPFVQAFVDMRMPPGWDGLETIENLWRVDPTIQVVIVTAYSDYTWRDISDRLGDTGNLLVLKKPFDSVEVAQITNTLARKWKFAQQARLRMHDLNNMVQTRTHELEIARQRAEASCAIKGEFLANMSHEIRTPMNAIIGFSEMLMDDELKQEQHEFVETINDAAKNLLCIVNDILDFSKMEAGKLHIAKEPTDIESVLDSIEALHRFSAQQSGIEFSVNRLTSMPDVMMTDPTRLRQCLVNLLSNAIKFTREGHVKLNVSQETIKDIPVMQFEIEDTGIGIEQDKLGLIFEAFSQADTSIIKDFGGTGLGLSITKKLVELMGGKISLTSEFGVGTTFTLRLPLGMPVGGVHDSHANESSQKLLCADHQYSGTVLVVEDAISNLKIITKLLERMGLEVVTAADGMQAIEAVEKQPFDLIFMDMQMPVMDGYTATAQLKKMKIKTPVIALTANVMVGDREKCLKAGCDGFVTKPIDRHDLIATLDTFLLNKVTA